MMSLSMSTSLSPLASRTDARPLAEALLAALREALCGCIAGENSESSLRPAIRVLCLEARREELRIEQLLISVKLAWQYLPEVRTPPLDGSRSHLLDRVISMCIEEFYGKGG
jgi:hypothetical protein